MLALTLFFSCNSLVLWDRSTLLVDGSSHLEQTKDILLPKEQPPFRSIDQLSHHQLQMDFTVASAQHPMVSKEVNSGIASMSGVQ